MGEISLKLNGKLETKDVADNTLLIDFIREHVGLTGTHVGCDTSQWVLALFIWMGCPLKHAQC